MITISRSRKHRSATYRKIRAGFMTESGLPFSDVLPPDRIEHVFAKHDGVFGLRGAIYSTVTTVWAFLSQVLCDGKEASCQAAVARISVQQQLAGLPVPSADTGDYCHARAKLKEEALRDLVTEVAEELEAKAVSGWLWHDRHVKLVDGFTFTMPDTDANQAAYPQQSSQKAGIGFPIARACAILSLATACISNFAFGQYKGKETGETALLREMFDSLQKGDVLVADRYYCSFLMIALLVALGVDVCVRAHPNRHISFRRGKRLGRYDRLITWSKPTRCPEWMDEATFASIPETLTLRQMRFNIVEPGCRAETITIITTLTDVEAYPAEDIAELYGFRWNSELDILAIKQTLGMDHLRCKSPEMVRKEIWITLLGYNLIRMTAAAAALLNGKRPRQISFTGTCQYVLASWMILSSGMVAPENLPEYCRTMLHLISQCKVQDRPGRMEPRVIKRRRHRYKLMQEPRAVLKAQLQHK